jgi:hypothetical protein
MAPGVMMADDEHHERDRDRDRAQVRRYYDRDARQWHDWNDGEQKAWRRYLQEQHRREMAWEHANRAQQKAYWKWRRDHPDVYGDRR